jgi:HD-like signal output (HDOD) protein
VIKCPFCSHQLAEDQKPADKAAITICAACMNPLVLAWDAHEVNSRPLAQARDIRQIAVEGSIGGALISELPHAIANLPMLPEIAQQVLRMTSDPDVTMTDLSRLIRQDPIIAVKIMKLANSALYGGLKEIKDLNTACARLGMKVICNAVQAAANGCLYQTSDPKLLTLMQQLWRHSMATAHCAVEMGIMLAMPRPEMLFLAGLVHDIGRLVLLEITARSTAPAVVQLRESPSLFEESFDNFHTLLGLHVVRHWGMPAEFSATTFCHHDPGLCPNEAWFPMIHIVALADAIAAAEGYAFSEPKQLFLSSHPSALYLNLTDIKLAGLRVDLEDKLEALLEAIQTG